MESDSRTFYLGRYNCIEQLGTGPLGETFRAKIYGVSGFEKQFAVKRLHPQLSADEGFVSRFVQAASAFAALEHQRIARVHEVNAQGAHYYIVIDLVRGLDLRRLLDLLRQRGEALAADVAATIAVDIAEALEYAHGRTTVLPGGVLHLGMTAQSVMVTYEGELKLVDVGLLAGLIRPGWSDDDALTPTLAYLPPEVWRGEGFDGGADIFSLGVLLHELTGGGRVFVSDRAAELRQAIEAGPPPPPPADPRFQKIITRALQPDRARRFATMKEMRAALQDIVGGRGDKARLDLSALVRRLALPRERRTGAFAAVTLPTTTTDMLTPVGAPKPPPIPPTARPWAPPATKPPVGPMMTVPAQSTIPGIGPGEATLSSEDLVELPGANGEAGAAGVHPEDAETHRMPRMDVGDRADHTSGAGTASDAASGESSSARAANGASSAAAAGRTKSSELPGTRSTVNGAAVNGAAATGAAAPTHEPARAGRPGEASASASERKILARIGNGPTAAIGDRAGSGSTELGATAADSHRRALAEVSGGEPSGAAGSSGSAANRDQQSTHATPIASDQTGAGGPRSNAAGGLTASGVGGAGERASSAGERQTPTEDAVAAAPAALNASGGGANGQSSATIGHEQPLAASEGAGSSARSTEAETGGAHVASGPTETSSVALAPASRGEEASWTPPTLSPPVPSPEPVFAAPTPMRAEPLEPIRSTVPGTKLPPRSAANWLAMAAIGGLAIAGGAAVYLGLRGAPTPTVAAPPANPSAPTGTQTATAPGNSGVANGQGLPGAMNDEPGNAGSATGARGTANHAIVNLAAAARAQNAGNSSGGVPGPNGTSSDSSAANARLSGSAAATANAGQSGSSIAQATQPGASGANATQSGSPTANATQSGSPTANATQSGSPTANAARSGSSVANVSQSGASAANAARSNSSAANVSQAGSPQSIASSSGAARSSISSPGAPTNGAGQPPSNSTASQPRVASAPDSSSSRAGAANSNARTGASDSNVAGTSDAKAMASQAAPNAGSSQATHAGAAKPADGTTKSAAASANAVEKPATGTGNFTIASEPPGAAIFVDGEPQGTTPTRLTLTPGAHKVVVAGEHQKLLTRDFTAAPGGQLALTLEPAKLPAEIAGPAGLKVRCHSHGELRILVDGADSGLDCPNDERISVAPGVHKIGLYSLRTGQTHEVEHEVVDGDYSTRVYVKF